MPFLHQGLRPAAALNGIEAAQTDLERERRTSQERAVVEAPRKQCLDPKSAV
jgi:hypothetical protein